MIFRRRQEIIRTKFVALETSLVKIFGNDMVQRYPAIFARGDAHLGVIVDGFGRDGGGGVDEPYFLKKSALFWVELQR